MLLGGPVHAQAVRLPVGDRAGSCDQRGRVALRGEGDAELGRARGQQAELADRLADVGEGQPALVVDGLLSNPLEGGHHRLIVATQASGLHQPQTSSR
ncbi:hypothetical protein ABT075_21895 [Streptomyces sp. NPDC002677]|uniref:hypothetical protein n=1 Tax=Streptomyces sp. NPDC002677 TaxID=3154774 RepID=UPI00331E47C9